MKLILSCIISIVAKLLIIIGILCFIAIMVLGVMAPPWVQWIQDFSFIVRIIITVVAAILVAYILISGGMKVSHLADRFIEKH